MGRREWEKLWWSLYCLSTNIHQGVVATELKTNKVDNNAHPIDPNVNTKVHEWVSHGGKDSNYS
jgi:hypothetical protein